MTYSDQGRVMETHREHELINKCDALRDELATYKAYMAISIKRRRIGRKGTDNERKSDGYMIAYTTHALAFIGVPRNQWPYIE